MTEPATAERSRLRARVELPGGAHALFTTRAGGNLSTVSGPDRDQAGAARARLRASLGLLGLCNGRQVHGTVVRQLREAPVGDDTVDVDADGHVTTLPGIGLMVLVADCLPVVLAADGAVAAVHAGWRGLADGVLEEGVRALRALTATDAEIVAVIGPCAGACCYEVGPVVLEAFGHAHHRGRFIDLRAIASERLVRAGVKRVEQVELCTICDPGFFSHRREGESAGRQAGLAWLS